MYTISIDIILLSLGSLIIRVIGLCLDRQAAFCVLTGLVIAGHKVIMGSEILAPCASLPEFWSERGCIKSQGFISFIPFQFTSESER